MAACWTNEFVLLAARGYILYIHFWHIPVSGRTRTVMNLFFFSQKIPDVCGWRRYHKTTKKLWVRITDEHRTFENINGRKFGSFRTEWHSGNTQGYEDSSSLYMEMYCMQKARIPRVCMQETTIRIRKIGTAFVWFLWVGIQTRKTITLI